MNIMFLTLSRFENLNDKQIYNDLINEIATRGHNISIFCPSDKNNFLDKTFSNINIYRVEIGEIRNTNRLTKGYNTLRLERRFRKKINATLDISDIDIIMYSTPPITFNNLIAQFKKKNNKLISLLLLKDIFPQNAVDLGYFRANALFHKYFKRREKALYRNSDLIACMSEKNIEYIIEKENIPEKKLFIFRNALFKNDLSYSEGEREIILRKYNLDTNKVTFIYGGNLGVPQYLEGIKFLIKNFSKVPNSQLIIVGDGTQYNLIKEAVKKTNDDNVFLLKKLPSEQFDKLLNYADVGLIFLHPDFTIPNFPSRLSSYLKFGKPVLAFTDSNTDVKETILDNKIGYWNHALDHDEIINNVIKIANNPDRYVMGQNAMELFDKSFSIEKNVNLLFEEIANFEKNI